MVMESLVDTLENMTPEGVRDYFNWEEVCRMFDADSGQAQWLQHGVLPAQASLQPFRRHAQRGEGDLLSVYSKDSGYDLLAEDW